MTNPALSKVGRSLTYRSFQRKYCDVFAIQIPGVKGLKVGTRGSESEHGPWIARLRLPAVEHTAVGSCLLVSPTCIVAQSISGFRTSHVI